MVILPFFADQPKNAKRMEYWNAAITLDPDSLTSNMLEQAIVKVGSNSR